MPPPRGMPGKISYRVSDEEGTRVAGSMEVPSFVSSTRRIRVEFLRRETFPFVSFNSLKSWTILGRNKKVAVQRSPLEIGLAY